MEEGEVSSRSQTRRTPLVLAAYLVLFLAAFIGLAPLFQIVAPLHAAGLDARAKTEILSRAMVWGAVTAAVANIAMGAISDRTRSRFGRRRPWIALGAVLTVLSYVGIWRSATPGQFVWAIIGFQLAFNVLMAPLSAVFAERALLAGVLLAAAALFLIVFDEPASTEGPLSQAIPPAVARGAVFDPFRSRNFVVVWTCRLLIATGYALVSVYLLYFITDAVGWAGRTPESAHALLTGVGFGGVVIVAGLVAVFGRRIRRRQPVALIGAALLCGATLVLALTPSWIVAVVAFAAYGLGQGAYGSVEMGLMADALPSRENRGRDMGLNNLAVALPQALAPLAALILERADIDVRGLYIAAAACFASAVVVVGLFRRQA